MDKVTFNIAAYTVVALFALSSSAMACPGGIDNCNQDEESVEQELISTGCGKDEDCYQEKEEIHNISSGVNDGNGTKVQDDDIMYAKGVEDGNVFPDLEEEMLIACSSYIFLTSEEDKKGTRDGNGVIDDFKNYFTNC